MKVALQGLPQKQLPRPDGLVTTKINADTGEAATDDDVSAIFELFRKENVPTVSSVTPLGGEGGSDAAPIPEQLF